MAEYNIEFKEVTKNEWTVEGGTALEALNKGKVESETPSLTPDLFSSENSKVIEAKVQLGSGKGKELKEALEAGATINGLIFHEYGKSGSKEDFQIGFVGNAGKLSGSAKNTAEVAAWLALTAVESQAKELTASLLEATIFTIQKQKTNKGFAYAAYVTIKTEAAATTTNLLSMLV